MGRISRWFPPFTGVLFVAFVVAITILIGQGQDASKKTAQEIVNHYQDHNTRESVGAILIVFASSLILYFGGWLRRLLREAVSDNQALIDYVHAVRNRAEIIDRHVRPTVA